MASAEKALARPKAIIFDLMGTLLDWHSSIVPVLTQTVKKVQTHPDDAKVDAEISELALAWRQAFFDEIHRRFRAAEPPEDIDITHRRTLTELIASERWIPYAKMASEDIEACVQAWHNQVRKMLSSFFIC